MANGHILVKRFSCQGLERQENPRQAAAGLEIRKADRGNGFSEAAIWVKFLEMPSNQ
jgi:hypothetical protein